MIRLEADCKPGVDYMPAAMPTPHAEPGRQTPTAPAGGAASCTRRDLNRYDGLIMQAQAYMRQHHANESLSLADVAAHVNVSPNHFSTVFRRETGVSFIRHLTDIRMTRAIELLTSTDLHCAEIGSAVGYRDPHYFSFLFKKQRGMTPMQVRFLGKT